MERDTRKDVMLAGFLALLIHAALIPLQFSGFRGSNLSGRQGRIVVDLVARRPAAEVHAPSRDSEIAKERAAKKLVPRKQQKRKNVAITKQKKTFPEKKENLKQQAALVQRSPGKHKDTDVQPLSPADVSTTPLSPTASSGPPEAAATKDVSSPAPSGQASAQDQASLDAGDSLGSSRSFVEAQSPRYGYRREPRYPRVAVRRGYEGTVLLRVRVLRSGRVDQVEIEESSGYRILDKSALEAVKTWRFTPARRGDKKVVSWALVPITFKLK
jgi:TonB family protein